MEQNWGRRRLRGHEHAPIYMMSYLPDMVRRLLAWYVLYHFTQFDMSRVTGPPKCRIFGPCHWSQSALSNVPSGRLWALRRGALSRAPNKASPLDFWRLSQLTFLDYEVE